MDKFKRDRSGKPAKVEKEIEAIKPVPEISLEQRIIELEQRVFRLEQALGVARDRKIA